MDEICLEIGIYIFWEGIIFVVYYKIKLLIL
jgi:hypothetical protein